MGGVWNPSLFMLNMAESGLNVDNVVKVLKLVKKNQLRKYAAVIPAIYY